MIKKNDIIQIEYTGRFLDGDKVFDTTDIEVAKKNELYHEESKNSFGPMTICIGQGQIIKGIEDALIGKKVDEEFNIELQPEEAFGKKKSELINLIPMSHFKKDNIRPVPGMHVNIDNSFGIIRTVSGGRVLVDFNHPFSGKEVKYKVKILKKIEDKTEQVKILTKSLFRMESDVSYDKDKNVVELKLKLPANIPKETFTDKIKNTISAQIKEIVGTEIKLTL